MPQEKGLIYLNENAWKNLDITINKLDPSSIFVLVDTETDKHCLPYFTEKFNSISTFSVLRIKAGETHKNISTCISIWEELVELGADRNSLIINLGGGVVTDLGGFIASTFKRGIPFINIPTSLLAMVDASVGGKTGIDLGNIKNQIGTIQLPEIVLIDTLFLDSLPKPQLLSGMAEMIKHGLIKGEDEWEKIKLMNPNNKQDFEKLIWDSIHIKNSVVLEDPLEKGRRKVLNFGHTLGHAIESYFLSNNDKTPLLHGEAIAIGMILAVYLSNKKVGLEKNKLNSISKHIISLYPKQDFTIKDIEEIQSLTIYDKKNRNGKVLFVLMNDFSNFTNDCHVDNQLILNAFEYYSGL